MLTGERVVLRPVRAEDVDRLTEILREPAVAGWWGDWDGERVRRELIADDEVVVYAIEAGGETIGLVQYWEETDPDYRHAGLDVALATAWHRQGYGSEALRVLARHLLEERGHHRLTIDPAASNKLAIGRTRRSASAPSASCAGTSVPPTGPGGTGS
jgi:aminoglycoside 6'-N-acetyltransferase